MNRSTAGFVAGAFASLLWDQGLHIAGDAGSIAVRGVPRSGPVVVLAHDERPSSPDIVTGVGAALRRMGCQVVDVGLATRPCFWFAVDHLQALGGVHVTGSGCDPVITGLDSVGRQALPCSAGGGLDAIADKLNAGYARPTRRPGTQRTFQARLPYEAGFWKHFHALRPLKVALACPSRPVGDLVGRLFRKLACRMIPVETPSRARDLADPRDSDLVRTARAVRSSGAHFGLLIGDDGQRCAFLDETGTLVPPHKLAPLLAKLELDESPGGTIIFESSSAGAAEERSAPSDARGWILTGDTLGDVALALAKHQGIFAGGNSGRYWFRETFPTSDAVLTLAKVLQALSRSDQPFSEVVSRAPSVRSLEGT
jgi:phosphomannomutase